ncbi:MAG TPA: RHS repeat domain-containing protein [Gaiellaceae bacterium]|nr:RHS repeat domain-containing protein [Gaiellaceae bacterium]
MYVANTAGTKYDAWWGTAAVPQEMTYDPSAATQQTTPIDVSVFNGSSGTWSASTVKLYYRWYSPDPALPNPIVTNSAPISLPADVPSFGQTDVVAQVPPPTLPDGVDRAQYRLRFDLADTSSGTPVFFADKGNQPLDNPVIVNKLLDARALGLERYYHYVGESVGAGMTHLVNVANGNSLLRWTPFDSPGRGLSTVVDITYNSLEKKSDSPIGHNFSISVSTLNRLGLPLDIHPNNAATNCPNTTSCWVELTDGDGTTHHFIGHTAADGTIWFEEPAGVHLYLRANNSADPSKRWAVTRPDRVTFFYDDQGFPTGVEDKNGNRLDFTLANIAPEDDPGGVKKVIVKVTDAAGQGATPDPKRSFVLDYYTKDEVKKPQMRGKLQSITDHEGHQLYFDYYADGNLLRMTQKGGGLSRSFVFTYTNSPGDAPAIPLASDRVNPDPTTANESTRLYSVLDPRGNETRFDYYGPTSAQLRWKLNKRTDRLGNVTTFAYDLANRVTTVTEPLSRVSKYGYDTDGKVTSITNPKNETTT